MTANDDLEQWLDRMEAKQADQAKELDRVVAALARLVSAHQKTGASLERYIGMVERTHGLPQSRSRPALRLVVDAQVETDGMARATARTRRSRRKPPAKS